MGFHWPENFKTVPLSEYVDERSKTCHFKDGSTADVDAIILCTGYKHHFPFISDELRLRTPNLFTPNNLYKTIFLEDNPKMMYFGMAGGWYSLTKFDAQARYARDVMLGSIELPTKDMRLADYEKWRHREGTLQSHEEMMVFEGDQVKELLEATDCPSFDIDGVSKNLFEWEHHKRENIMTFRDKGFKSVMTGNLAPVHHTPWLQALDDSLECYVRPAAKGAIGGG